MKNIPKTIYLQIGKDRPTDDGEDFNDLSEVSWCADKIFENDIEYVLKENDYKEITGFYSPAERLAYEQGRAHEEEVIFNYIKSWNGHTNSALGELLYKIQSQLK
jgi:hypothetical protein